MRHKHILEEDLTVGPKPATLNDLVRAVEKLEKTGHLGAHISITGREDDGDSEPRLLRHGITIRAEWSEVVDHG